MIPYTSIRFDDQTTAYVVDSFHNKSKHDTVQIIQIKINFLEKLLFVFSFQHTSTRISYNLVLLQHYDIQKFDPNFKLDQIQLLETTQVIEVKHVFKKIELIPEIGTKKYFILE